jgi:methylmalonyl-CoA/ethylmalonyl-CoA epimerase
MPAALAGAVVSVGQDNPPERAMSLPAAEFALARIGQIALPVRDLERAVAFYRDTLGVPFLMQVPPGLAFFDCAGTRLMLSRPERGVEGHASVLYFTVDDIRAAHEALTGRGVAFVDEPHLIGRLPDREVWMCFFRDSEENLLALMSEVRI